MAESLKSVPENFESRVAECLAARAKALSKVTGLGPPDLCHLTKVQEKQPGLLRHSTQPPLPLGSYHYCYGVDVSSPASVAAYFNTMVNDLGLGAWRIQNGTYCAYNAFANVDVHIEVTMPGTVNPYVVDAMGHRYGCDDKIWQEVHVCSMLRALSMQSPRQQNIGSVHVVPFLLTQLEENTFLRYARCLFWQGRHLGTDELTAPPNNVNNRLTMGVKSYFFNACRFQQGIDWFQEYVAEDGEINVIIAEGLDLMGETAKGICLLARALEKMPSSHIMLMKQSQLLLSIGDVSTALEVAKMVAELAPAQALPWLNLATTYAAAKNYAMSLVALNVTPMAHGPDSPLPDMPSPARVSSVSKVLQDMQEELEPGDPTLSSLPGSALHGTFVLAYDVLTRILTEISWDNLLNVRSRVFLMEEEYTATFRQQTAMPSQPANHAEALTSLADEKEGEESQPNENENAMAESPSQLTNHTKAPISVSDAVEDGAETVVGGKRLLERWLDQLFTALYQDLMCSVIWNAQASHARKNNTPEDHTMGDCLRYGQLRLRLHAKDDALKAFQECATIGTCLPGLFEILDIYSSDGFIDETFSCLATIGQFMESHPTFPVARQFDEAVCRLVSRHGLKAVKQLGEAALKKSPQIRNSVYNAVNWKVYGYNR